MQENDPPLSKRTETALRGPETRVRRQLLRYALVGAFNTALTFATYSGLVALGVPYFVANLAGMTLSVSVGYLLSRGLVFDQAKQAWTESAWKYVATFASQYLVGTAAIGFLIAVGMGKIVSWLVAAPAMVAVSFVLQKWWVFGERTRAP